jgi:hypothetical protein
MNGREPRQESATVPPNPESVAYESGEQLLLLPDCEQPPQCPQRGTLAYRLLGMFAEGARLTHPDFQALTGSWRLAAVAFELGLLGWPLTVERIAAPTPERPDRTIARYSFDASARSAALEILR